LDASPDIYPLRIDLAPGHAHLVRMSEALYREASFLNDQLLDRAGPVRLAPLAELRDAAANLNGESDFIFHIGHVGSTLLSRVLGDHEQVFALREPAPLRTLAIAEALSPRREEAAAALQAWVPVLSRLHARVYRPGQRSLVKATSLVSEIGPALLAQAPSAQAILMFAMPASYLPTMLYTPAARADARSMATLRLARLNRSFGGAGWAPPTASDGEVAALGWASEICALADIARRHPARVLWLDFDAFLGKPAAGLRRVLEKLHGAADDDVVEALAASAHFGRYSKAPEHAYDAALRRRILAEAWSLHRAEIDRGIAWLNAAAAVHPALTAAARQIAVLPKLA
jgi:hypothetical protein